MITEQLMEDKIADEPSKYIGEEGLKLVARQYTIGQYRFDLIFEDRHGAKLIVELQRGTLDRNHTYKILDYYDEYKEAHPKDFIELMVIANTIPQERKARLSAHGISFKEIPESEFIEDMDDISIDDEIHEETPQEKVMRIRTYKDGNNHGNQLPFLKHPKNISAKWHEPSLAKVEKWIRTRIKEMSPGITVSIGDFAKASRSVAHILPQGNIDGVRYLLSKLYEEKLIDFTDNLHFRILDRQEA